MNPKVTTNCTVTNSALLPAGEAKHFSVYLDIETLGLNAYEDRITCIGVIIDDNDRCYGTKIFNNVNEQKLLADFVKFYYSISKKDPNRYIRDTITWNGRSFDLPYLQVRCLKYGLVFGAVFPIDAKLLLPEFEFDGKWRRPSLAETAAFLGIRLGKKEEFDGKDAVTLAKLGLNQKLAEYCLNDVVLLRSVYLKLRTQIW